jgi:hypothetical protein
MTIINPLAEARGNSNNFSHPYILSIRGYGPGFFLTKKTIAILLPLQQILKA